MPRTWHKHLTGAALILATASCGTARNDATLQATSTSSPPWQEASIDSTLLEVRMFKLIGETTGVFSELPKSGFPLVIMSQNQSLIGFAINCKNGDSRTSTVARSFGDVYLDTGDIESITQQDIEDFYKVSEQPFLRCDALNGQNQVAPLFSQLYRVIDTAQNRSHIVGRFNTFSPLDKKLFEVGCQNILKNFQRPTDPVVPIYIENLADIPGGDGIGALHCFDTSNAIASDLSIPSASPRAKPFDARLFRVQDDETNISRVLLTGGRAFRLDCQAPDSSLQAAFGLPNTGELQTLSPSDPEFTEYLDGRIEEQPTLSCESATRPQFASDAYQIVNQKDQSIPLLRLKAFENTLVQFSCDSAANFFGKSILDQVKADPTRLQKVIDQSIESLVRSYVPGQPKARVYDIGCAASNLSAEDISRIYRDVYGRDITTDLLSKNEAACRAQGSVCSSSWMELNFVDALKKSPQESEQLVVSAFTAVLNRAPFAEELTYFKRKFAENGALRPHSRELQTFLKTAKTLDRTLFTAAVRQAFGVDSQDALLDQWTTRQFDEPTLVITADFLKKEFDALIRKQYQDVVIKRVYQNVYGTVAQAFQIAGIKKQITAGTLGASYTDISAMLQKLTQECVTVSPKVLTQPFTFMRPRNKVVITGTWTAVADGKDKVGPAGSKEKYTANNWTVNSLNLSRLLVAQKNSAGAWGAWAGWTSSMTFNKISEINLIINDKKDAYGDNTGSLKACFQ